MESTQKTIEAAWDGRAKINPGNAPKALRDTIAQVLDALDGGRVRVAEKKDGAWHTNE